MPSPFMLRRLRHFDTYLRAYFDVTPYFAAAATTPFALHVDADRRAMRYYYALFTLIMFREAMRAAAADAATLLRRYA